MAVLYHNRVWFLFHKRKNCTTTQEQVVHQEGKELHMHFMVQLWPTAPCTTHSEASTSHLIWSFCFMYRIQSHKVKPLLPLITKTKNKIKILDYRVFYYIKSKYLIAFLFCFFSYCTKYSSQHHITLIKEICRKSFNLQVLGIVPFNF